MGGIAAVLLFGLLGTCAAVAIWRMDDPAPIDTLIPLRVDASLDGEGARVVTERWPSVRFEPAADGSVVLGVFDSAPDRMSQHVELTLRLGSGAEVVPARVRWYDPHGIMFFMALEYGEAIQGSVTIDADRPPARGDERIVAYDLRATRDGHPVELRGKVRIPYAPRPRR